MSEFTVLSTKLGQVKGVAFEDYDAFYSIPFATAKRYEYGKNIDSWEGILDATTHGAVMSQYRQYHPHLDVPERAFYYKEFRQDIDFQYDEDALNLNIFKPKDNGKHPVLVFIHGGGFNSGSNYDHAIQGQAYAQKGIIFVSIQYRVGPFGYFAHEEIKDAFGREGNFGLDDQFLAMTWIKNHIADFGGDPENITVMGQSAGAISIQFMCLNAKWNGLFHHAIMLSGAGAFPSFAQPKPAADTRAYWQDVIETSGAKSFAEFKAMDTKQILDAWEEVRARRKDNSYNAMPVIDGYFLTDTVSNLIHKPLPVDYMVGITNNDMFAPLLAKVGYAFGKENSAFMYYFDVDAPGDNNKAFHSADLYYVFGSQADSWRPYDANHREISRMLMQYIINFATNGNPNLPGKQDLPSWKNDGRVMHFVEDPKKVKMGHPNWLKLTYHWLKIGDPK